MTIRGLATFAEQFKESQAGRDKVVNQGRLAYRMGIEFRNCPLKELSQRKLWEAGWTKEEITFKQMLDRWKAL